MCINQLLSRRIQDLAISFDSTHEDDSPLHVVGLEGYVALGSRSTCGLGFCHIIQRK